MYPVFTIFGKSVPVYGLCMVIGLLLSCWLACIRAGKRRLDINSVFVIAAFSVGLGLLGAKLLYLFVSCDIQDVIISLKRGNTTYLTQSGFVFYGGLICGCIGAFLGIRVAGETKNAADYCNAIVPAIPLGHACGRIGCYFGGCCYGIYYTGFGAVTFPRAGITEPVFPVQLLEATLNILLCVVLEFLGKKQYKDFTLLYVYILSYSCIRFMTEFLRGDEIRGIMLGLSTSQWVSAGIFILSAVLLTKTSLRKQVCLRK